MAIDRVLLIVLDSVGAGALPDAAAYGDEGSDTLGHIAQAVPLCIPTLRALGLSRVANIGDPPAAVPYVGRTELRSARTDAADNGLGDHDLADQSSVRPTYAGTADQSSVRPTYAGTADQSSVRPAYAGAGHGAAVGRMAEASAGKDSVTGHWEMTGVVLDHAFPTFPHGFPATLMREFERRIGRKTIGNLPASGTAIIAERGDAHMRTGAPIVYTSADSVFQIAAHESVIPVPELYRMCEIAFELAARGLGVARVIARPFVGEPGHFTRTANRRDFALPPSGPTLLDRLIEAGHTVVAIGKIEDLFASRGISRAIHTTSDAHGMDVLEAELATTTRGLVFTNLVDFDTEFGHRNDVRGYAANLERFDARLARLLPRLTDRDLLVVTADHGNDPTTPSTDHSREYVPVLLYGQDVAAGRDIGTRRTFADLGQTLASIFAVPALPHGTSFLPEILR